MYSIKPSDKDNEDFREFLRTYKPSRIDPELIQKIDHFGKEIIRQRMQQQEAFLSEHLDKIGTHVLCLYPETSRTEGDTGGASLPLTTYHEQLIALAPIGLSILTPEDAIENYPHVFVRWSITLLNCGDYGSWLRRQRGEAGTPPNGVGYPARVAGSNDFSSRDLSDNHFDNQLISDVISQISE